MKKPNRKCVICGTEYYYCNHSCTDSLNKPAWMTSFCCESCKNTYDAAAKYHMQKISAEEAREILDTCDLSNKDNFAAFTKNLINEIYDTVGMLCEEPNSFIVEEMSDLFAITSDRELTATLNKDMDVVVTEATDVVQPVKVYAQPTTYKKKRKRRKMIDSDFI